MDFIIQNYSFGKIIINNKLYTTDLILGNAKIYPNWILLGVISGAGAAVGEVTSYIVGRLIARTKSIEDTELGEKFHRMKD